MMKTYETVGEIPSRLPLFPLTGAIMLPRTQLPLNIFEPRYLKMLDDALAGERLIVMVQPEQGEEDVEPPEDRDVALRKVGGIGRITMFQETDDGRCIIGLCGVCRCEISSECETGTPYRVANISCAAYADDLDQGGGADDVDRDELLGTFKAYLKANGLNADWDAIRDSDNEFLVNTLAMISPYGPEEKQALLEAGDLKTRAEVLIALAEMDLATSQSGPGTMIQ